jgi:hypothetical protein
MKFNVPFSLDNDAFRIPTMTPNCLLSYSNGIGNYVACSLVFDDLLAGGSRSFNTV